MVSLPRKETAVQTNLSAEDDKNLDVNHTHFVLNEQERQAWQAEMLCRLAKAATKNKDWILTVLVGGETAGTAYGSGAGNSPPGLALWW